MDAIVNVTENWGIGLKNRLLVSISADLRRFRALTEGKTVVLGRKTLETFPNGKPLKHRRNIIMSTDSAYTVEGAEVCHSLPELFTMLQDINKDEVCLIGGASLYEALLPYCSHVVATKTYLTLPADRFFPNLDELSNWHITARSELQEENGIRFQYFVYENQTPRPPQPLAPR